MPVFSTQRNPNSVFALLMTVPTVWRVITRSCRGMGGLLTRLINLPDSLTLLGAAVCGIKYFRAGILVCLYLLVIVNILFLILNVKVK